LLRAALSISSTKTEDALGDAVKTQVTHWATFPEALLPSHMEQLLNVGERRVFVIDGVETAVPAKDLRSFVEGLFRFLAAVQYDRTLSKSIAIKLLLRTDLVTGAAQNVEQQIEGSVIYLHWNKKAILNFALARILSLPWFVSNFSSVCDVILEKISTIQRGALPEEECEDLLLKIFPKGLERNRLKTTTFFASYFSDAGGEASNDLAFYPRLFDGFLRTLAINCAESVSKNIINDRISSSSVLQAYDQASKSFIEDVRTELYSFLNIEVEADANKKAVDSLISAFNGLQTPFATEEMVSTLADRTNINVDAIRLALTSMQKIGMFDVRPGYSGELRARQLYKAGLGMKYVRKKIQD
jgi:hypothetical protein